MVDQQRSGLQRLQCALRAGGDLENIFIVTHAEHDGVLICGRGGRRCRNDSTEGCLPRVGARLGAVKNRNGVPRPGEVSGHGVPHGTQTNKGNAFSRGHLSLILAVIRVITA